MRILKCAAITGLAVALAGVMAGPANAQVRIGIGIGTPVYVGPPPVCAYGYYPYAPYACAPYGYYGTEWFVNGIFIGAGPWFHGFYGPAFYGRRYFDFHDPAWVYFHDRDGWRYYRGGDRWRDFGRDGWRGHDERDGWGARAGWSDFPGREAFRGDDHHDARYGRDFHAGAGFRGGDHAFGGNGGSYENGRFHGRRGRGNVDHGHGGHR